MPRTRKRQVTAAEDKKAEDEWWQKEMEIPYEGLPQQPISDKARKSRDRAWKLWEESCNNRNIDPCQIWLDLCLEKQQAETYCQKFLKRYIVDSVALCPTIGEGEVEEVQQVKATRTMARLWQDLIEEADERVLNKKRRDNPLSRHQWQLRCPKGDNEKRYPAGRIHQTSFHTLSLFGATLETYLATQGRESGSTLQLFWLDWVDFDQESTSTLTLLDDAFEAGYQSFEEVLRRPTLENVDYVKLGWKKCFEDKPIFPIAQAAFWKWWVTVQRVSGCREPTRPYSARVGAAQELNGALVPSLRNYVMSNSSAVFEKSYLPRQFPRCLASIAFKAKAGDSEDITKVFRDAKLKNDIHAPLYVSAERLRSFEERNDVREQRKKLEVAAKSDPQNGEVQRLRASLNSYLETLKREALKEEREKYFKEADTLRSRGLSTDYLRQTHTGERPKRRFGATADMATAIGEILKQEHNDISQVRVRYAAMVLAYLRFQPTARVFDKDRSDYEVVSLLPTSRSFGREVETSSGKSVKSVCLLCNIPFSRGPGLTRHVRKQHIQQGTFSRSFPCPQCYLQDNEVYLVTSPSNWSNHIAQKHGKVNVPNLPPKPSTAELPSAEPSTTESALYHRCFICYGRRNGISIDLVIPGEDSHVVGNKHPRADEDTMLEVIWPSKKKWKGPSESPPSDAMFFSTRIDDVASSEDTMVMDPRLVQIQAALRCEEPSWAVGESHVHTEYFQAA
ncbi:hypothetical protein CSUB01_09910 [Colletotrichum sublineola]|uniref:C2H2-type domain-containing protein n=1 Tax=Colletotrichum sublineola TaxID=1173701 RepID=A0A066XZM1_COLSU|nr:hypothetical protein CSUB01_09910 [Colletotrichum sublineola]